MRKYSIIQGWVQWEIADSYVLPYFQNNEMRGERIEMRGKRIEAYRTLY